MARRTAVDSTCAAVTPNDRRIDSRCRARVAVSNEPTGSLRSATIVWTKVESVISVNTGSFAHAVSETAARTRNNVRTSAMRLESWDS